MLPALRIHPLQVSTLSRNCLFGTASIWVDATVEAESIPSITLSTEDSRVDSSLFWHSCGYSKAYCCSLSFSVWLTWNSPPLPLNFQPCPLTDSLSLWSFTFSSSFPHCLFHLSLPILYVFTPSYFLSPFLLPLFFICPPSIHLSSGLLLAFQ